MKVKYKQKNQIKKKERNNERKTERNNGIHIKVLSCGEYLGTLLKERK